MIVVYSKHNCPYCVQTKQYLENHNINYREVNIELEPKAREFVISQGHRSVPQIYVGEHLLVEGGWQALSKLSSQEIMDRVAGLVNSRGSNAQI
jgi:glutaredoxin